MTASRPRIALAFSGGLDTSFCVVWLRQELQADVTTVTVDTGGFDAPELSRIESLARELGAAQHLTLDARQELYERFLSFLIRGNVLRGRVYPLSVAAERVLQAERVARVARDLGADGIAHGSTGAGNDQVRFDAVFRTLVPELPLHTPIRDLGWSREREAAYLAEHGVRVPARTTNYSVNAGLWGTTIGGRETHDAWVEPPPDAFGPTQAPPAVSRELIIGFEQGLPVSLDGEPMAGLRIVETLRDIGVAYGVGRGIHIGDTVIGIKGRIGFEAPAPHVLIAAHRELEKLVLSRWQSFWKDHLADFYGQQLHEGLYFDPVMRDIEALLAQSQTTVTGEARIRFTSGAFTVTGVRSPHSILDLQAATYGETSRAWSGDEAAAFAKLHALPMSLAHQARQALKPSQDA